WIRKQLGGSLPGIRHLRRRSSEGTKAGRSSGRAAHGLRPRHQHEDRDGPRPHISVFDPPASNLGHHLRRRDFLRLAGAAAVVPAGPLALRAQGSAKLPRVALVSGAVPVLDMRSGRDTFFSGLIQELEKEGFAEGRTVIFERYTLPGNTVDLTQ